MPTQLGELFVASCSANPSALLFKFDKSAPEYLFSAIAASLATSIFQMEKTKQALANIVSCFYDARFPMRMATYNDPGRTRYIVDLFVNRIIHKFPCIVIDATITDFGIFGSHTGVPWEGSLEQFNPRKQSIHINAQRFQDLMHAGNPVPRSKEAWRRFRIFIFQLTNILIHEIGHLFTTFVSRNITTADGELERPLTPGIVSYGKYGSSCVGEAGLSLENYLFGGPIEYYCDLSAGPRQPGVPYVLGRNNLVRRIPQKVIDDFVIRQAFVFPYPLEGPAYHLSSMPSIYRIPDLVNSPSGSIRPSNCTRARRRGLLKIRLQIRRALVNQEVLAVAA